MTDIVSRVYYYYARDSKLLIGPVLLYGPVPARLPGPARDWVLQCTAITSSESTARLYCSIHVGTQTSWCRVPGRINGTTTSEQVCVCGLTACITHCILQTGGGGGSLVGSTASPTSSGLGVAASSLITGDPVPPAIIHRRGHCLP